MDRIKKDCLKKGRKTSDKGLADFFFVINSESRLISRCFNRKE